MKVSELIEKLKEFDGEDNVFIDFNNTPSESTMIIQTKAQDVFHHPNSVFITGGQSEENILKRKNRKQDIQTSN